MRQPSAGASKGHKKGCLNVLDKRTFHDRSTIVPSQLDSWIKNKVIPFKKQQKIMEKLPLCLFKAEPRYLSISWRADGVHRTRWPMVESMRVSFEHHGWINVGSGLSWGRWKSTIRHSRCTNRPFNQPYMVNSKHHITLTNMETIVLYLWATGRGAEKILGRKRVLR